MRYLKKILLFFGLAIVLQLSTLFYIDKFYLSEKKDDNLKTVQQVDKQGKLQIPKDAENVQISWDGKYISYYENEELKVVDTETLEVSIMKFENNTKVSLYRWVKDKNRIILGGKQEDQFKSIVSFAYLDLNKKDNYQPLGSIVMPNKKSEVSEIECSYDENDIYVNVNDGGNRNSIYRLNGQGQVEKLQLKGFSIGNIEVMKQQNKLIYEDSVLKKIYILGENKAMDTKSIGEARLLSVDKNDNVYLAQIANDKVIKIYWGKQGNSIQEWNSKAFSEGIDLKDLMVSPDGKLYINNNLKGSVVQMDTNNETFYKGNFVQLYVDGVASIWEDNLIKTKFK